MTIATAQHGKAAFAIFPQQRIPVLPVFSWPLKKTIFSRICFPTPLACAIISKIRTKNLSQDFSVNGGFSHPKPDLFDDN